MKQMTLQEILSQPSTLPSGWLYLPNEKWDLNTFGVFSLEASEFAQNSDEYIPAEAKEHGWIEVLDNQTIEDIVDNVNLQLENPTLNDLFNAFVFYYDNDAVIEF